jgi:HemY protein
MAELERAERNDEGRAREWIARALHAASDPAWTAEGHVSDRWLPASPSGRLDAFEWRVPLTGIASRTPVIEPEASTATAAPVEGANEPKTDTIPILAEKAEAAPAMQEPEASGPARRRTGSTQPKPEAVIPLVHAPDDPGPDADVVEDIEPPREPNGGWRKMFE